MRRGWKRGHRMVVLPDYQGIGIGTAFENFTSEIYAEKGYGVNVTTTTPSLVNALIKSPHWALSRYGRVKTTWANFERYSTDVGKGAKNMKALAKSSSSKRVTYSFNYIKQHE